MSSVLRRLLPTGISFEDGEREMRRLVIHATMEPKQNKTNKQLGIEAGYTAPMTHNSSVLFDAEF